MQVAERAWTVEKIAEHFVDAAVRTVTDEQGRQNEAFEPGLGDGQIEEDVVVGVGRIKGVGESLLGLVGLLIDEFSADAMVVCQVGDRGTRQGVQGELPASLWR